MFDPKEYMREYNRKYYQKNKEAKREYNRQHQAKNREKYRQAARTYHADIRLKVLAAYSKGTIKCACCGEQEIKFLGIDHINGRKNEPIKRTGRNFYLYLLRTPYDDNLQVLCHNCNYAKGFYGSCPHASRA